MAIDNRVLGIAPGDNRSIRTNLMGAPLFGTVIAESGGPPINAATVLWHNGEVSIDVPIIALSKVFNLSTSLQQAARILKWVQLRGFPFFSDDVDDSGFPKSPAASGLVVDAYELGAYDAQVPEGDTYNVVAMEDGRQFIQTVEDEDEDNPIVTNDGRRNVRGQ
jgi:hypothetical protein